MASNDEPIVLVIKSLFESTFIQQYMSDIARYKFRGSSDSSPGLYFNKQVGEHTWFTGVDPQVTDNEVRSTSHKFTSRMRTGTDQNRSDNTIFTRTSMSTPVHVHPKVSVRMPTYYSGLAGTAVLHADMLVHLFEVKMRIGGSKMPQLRLAIDIGSGDTWVFGDNYRQFVPNKKRNTGGAIIAKWPKDLPDELRIHRQTVIEIDLNDEQQCTTNPIYIAGSKGVQITYVDGSSLMAGVIKTPLYLETQYGHGKPIKLSTFKLAVAYAISMKILIRQFDGILAIGRGITSAACTKFEVKPFHLALFMARLIDSPSFCMRILPRSYTIDRLGQSSFISFGSTWPISVDTGRFVEVPLVRNHSQWRVILKSFKFHNQQTNEETIDFTVDSEVILDTGSSLTYLPDVTIQDLYGVVGTDGGSDRMNSKYISGGPWFVYFTFGAEGTQERITVVAPAAYFLLSDIVFDIKNSNDTTFVSAVRSQGSLKEQEGNSGEDIESLVLDYGILGLNFFRCMMISFHEEEACLRMAGNFSIGFHDDNNTAKFPCLPVSVATT